MDRKEMEAKLTKHGLPTWGEDEQLRQRLINNGVIEAAKTVGEAHVALDNHEFSQPTGSFVTDEAMKVMTAPRKIGRPKKVK